MAKNILETTADFQLIDPETGVLIRHSGLTLNTPSQFTQARVLIGQVKVHGSVNDDATDEELQKFVAETPDDLELAVQAFLSAYPVEKPAEVAKTPESAKKGEKGKKAE